MPTRKKKYRVVSIAIKNADYQNIATYAERMGLSVSAFIQLQAFAHHIPKLVFASDKQYQAIYNQLHDIAAQYSTLAHLEKQLYNDQSHILFTKAIANQKQHHQPLNIALAKVALNDPKYNDSLTKCLKFYQHDLAPHYAQVSRQIVKLTRAINHHFFYR